MAGGVNIKVKFDVDKAVDQSLNGITKRINNVSTAFDSLVTKIKTGFDVSADSAKNLFEIINNSSKIKGIDTIINAINALEKAFRGGSISQEEYAEGIEKLQKKYEKLAYQADLTNKKLSPTNQLTNLERGNIAATRVSDTKIQSFNLPQLQQALVILENQKKVVGQTGEKYQKIIDLQDKLNLRLKEINLSTRQKNELIEKQKRLQEKLTEKSKAAAKSAAKSAERDLKAQERKTAQLEKQAIAKRRADGDKQYDFAMAMESKTLEQIIAKTKELEFARKKLDSTTKDGQDNIANVNKEMERLKIQQDAVLKSGLNLADANGKTSRSFRELAQIAGAYFSVYAVRNFMTEVANVTGEFDLQRKALQALLQDRIAADAIFEKIKAQAVQSPFSVMQLTSATKQLAAYRIEADNLFDTTMMLSDVSAGLGVDMERLILAFGQVKAASVLRGQEVRQFTEAGIPLISLLADKFGELEGRVVSTGEVFDKISNRLVPFEMINDIFKDMTASGGMFYEMQKLQAETIKGRLVNLTDAYQLFLDKMGTANSGIIKGFIGGLEAILRNMDSILPVLKGIIAGLITYKTLMVATNIAMGQNVTINKLKTLWHIKEAIALGQVNKANIAATLSANGLNSAFLRMIATNPWIALATAVVGVATAIGLAVYNAGKFNRELEKIETKGLEDYNNLYKTFERLVGVIKDNSKSIGEQNAAFEELKRTYRDILPEKLLNIDYIKKETIAYDQVKAAIYAKIKAQVQEQQITALQNEWGTKIIDLENKQIKGLQNIRNLTKEQAQSVLEVVKNTYLETNSVDAALKKYAELAGLKPTKEQLADNFNPVYAGIRTFLTEYGRYNKQINEITNNTLRGVDESFAKYGLELSNQYKKVIDHLPEIVKYYEKTWSKSSKDFDYRQQQEVKNRQVAWLNQNIDLLEKQGGTIQLKMAEDLRKELKNILGTEDQQAIKKNLERFANQFGVSLDKISTYLKSDQQGFREWTDSINEILDQRTQNLEQYKGAINKDDANVKGLINNEDAKAYENVNKMLQSLLIYYKALKTEKTTGTNTKDPLLNAIKEEISLIEKLTNEYQKLIKEGVKSDVARTTVADNFKSNMDSINKILSSKGVKTIDFASLIQSDDPKAFLNILEEQFNTIKNNPEVSKLLSASIGDVKTKIKIEELDKTENEIETFLEDIKKKYEISLEINEAQQGTRDLLMKMFGINETDIINDIGSLIDKVNEEIGKRLSEQGVETISKDFASLTTEQFNALLEPFKSKEGYGDIAKGLIKLFNFVQEKQKAYISNTAKAYGELLKNYADFNYQRTLVAENAEKEILALDARYKLAGLKQDEKYLRLKKAILNKSAQETAKINYEELKQSEEYLNLFDRIEILGEGNMVESYTKVRQGIVDAFASGTISLKQFKSQLAELDKQFQEFYMQTGNFVAYLKGGLDGLFKNMSETSYNIQAIAAKIEKIGSSGDPIKFFSNISQDEINYLEKKGIDINKIAQNTNFDTKAVANNLGTAAKGMSTVAAKGAGAAMWVQLIVQNIYGAIKGINELRAAFDRLSESQGDFVNQYTTDNDKFWTTLGNFNETAMQGFEQLKSGNVTGALATTIKSYVDIFSDFNELADKQIQEKIDDTTKAIDRQKDALDRLQKAVDKQLGSDWFAGMNQIAEGYNQIAEDTQAKINAAQGEKNPDEDLIYQYEQDLLDAEDNYKETIERMVEELTGTDIKSAAEDFASIWLDAFLQGEDAMAAIEDRFDDMIKNMIVKAISSKIVASILQKTFDAVEDAVADGDVTQAEIDRINAEGEYAMILINEKLGALGGWFQDLLGTGGTAETLQKGIQGITEQTAGIIEGYLNTIRYEIFRHTGILQSIQTQMQLNNNINSDILYQATLSYQVLVAIRDWQNSITTTDNGLPAIRVV